MESDSARKLVCQMHALPESASRGFVLEVNGETVDLFLVRLGQAVFAYRNSCPHTGGPLDWMPDQFLNMDADLIQCATHDALFQIETGLCVSGPCTGERLTAVKIVIENDAIWLETGA